MRDMEMGWWGGARRRENEDGWWDRSQTRWARVRRRGEEMRKGGGAVERMQGEGRVKPGGGAERSLWMKRPRAEIRKTPTGWWDNDHKREIIQENAEMKWCGEKNSHTGGNIKACDLITCARRRGRVQGRPEVVLLAHAHHRSFILRDAVGRAGKTLLLPGGHLVGAGGTRWRKQKREIRMCWIWSYSSFFPFFLLTRRSHLWRQILPEGINTWITRKRNSKPQVLPTKGGLWNIPQLL